MSEAAATARPPGGAANLDPDVVIDSDEIMEGDDSHVKARRKLSSSSTTSSDGDDDTVVDANEFVTFKNRNKQKKAKRGKRTPLVFDVNNNNGNQSGIQDKKGDPIFIRFLNNNVKISNPLRITKLLHQSVLGKYIVPGSVRMLGSGTGCRLEVCSKSKIPPVESITLMGSGDDIVEVKCRHPSEAKFFGRIGPIDLDVSVQEIMEEIRDLDGQEIVLVQRLKNKDGIDRDEIMIGTKESMPTGVKIGTINYRVYRHMKPPLRCYRCHFFGHGSLTCHTRQQRCARCGGFHDDLPDCSNPQFCFFCRGNHRYNDRQCEFNIKAWEVERQKLDGDITNDLAIKKYQELNKIAISRSNSGTGSASGQVGDENGSNPVNPGEQAGPSSRITPNVQNQDKSQSNVDKGAHSLDSNEWPPPRGWKTKFKETPIRKEAPRPEGVGEDPFGATTPVVKSKLYQQNTHKKPNNDDDKDDSSEESSFIALVIDAAMEIYDVFCNGKSFFTNVPTFFRILSPVFGRLFKNILNLINGGI